TESAPSDLSEVLGVPAEDEASDEDLLEEEGDDDIEPGERPTHSAPNALIFTPSAGEGSLSGPVASTGEILVTGSYELPKGLGSQGHAHGTTDGKEVDAVLIDGELPPASSPTPIAASSAVSTIKPAGEVIRPPAPEKGNRLMLIAAIVAGALALGLGTALVIAFTGNMLRIAADAAVAKGGEDLVALNVSEPLPLVDIFLLVTGNSERNVAAIADEIEDRLVESGHKRVRREGRAEARWVLLDFGDLIVHVFHQEERVYYGLERLWKDCPVIPLEVAETSADNA
ncbi:unnamed protein product, partial [Penicillium discolor]